MSYRCEVCPKCGGGIHVHPGRGGHCPNCGHWVSDATEFVDDKYGFTVTARNLDDSTTIEKSFADYYALRRWTFGRFKGNWRVDITTNKEPAKKYEDKE